MSVLKDIAAIGFRWVDIRSTDFTDDENSQRLYALNLQLSCVGLSFALPPDVSLDSADSAVRANAVTLAMHGLVHAATLGATAAYLIPGLDESQAALARYGHSLCTLADYAAARDIKLCIEHFPGRALPTIEQTVHYLASLQHPNLYLLFDIGHAQMTGEDPATALRQTHALLGYVHLDDNDGNNDLHWGLLDGVMTKTTLRQTLETLNEIGYTGGISLELSPQLPNPLAAIRRSWEILQELQPEEGTNGRTE